MNTHGSNNDYNISVAVTYDLQGRVLSVRDPNGNETTYEYDALGRRIKRSNPLGHEWTTAYSDLNGGEQVTQTYPGVNNDTPYNVVHTRDRLGRLIARTAGDPSVTPDVTHAYNNAGDRVSMTENNGTLNIRKTSYSYDEQHRLVAVATDANADNTPEHTIDYAYDRSGRRTKMTLPGGLEIGYTYDAKGRLTGVTDWDSQAATFTYDDVDRHIKTERANDLDTSYVYDPAGRLTEIHHQDTSGTPRTLAQFTYTVDGRGNRVQSNERLRQSDDTLVAQTWVYGYDQLGRVLTADRRDGWDTTTGTPARAYSYAYDPAGNRLRASLSLSGGIPSGVQSSYNAANQPNIVGTRVHTYDANGNLRGDGVDSYTWDRHNRMVSSGAHSYTYDGDNHRISQSINSVVTEYLNDTQPGLAQMVAAITGSDTTRYVHSPRGIHAQQTPSGDWVHLLSDGLGSVRSVVDALSAPLEIRHYDPYGNPFGGVGTAQTDFGFTGEVTDANEQLYLRARYYAPLTGTFTALDPWDGTPQRPMSLNGYSWVCPRPLKLSQEK